MRRVGRLARRYAKALFALGQERGDVSALLSEVDSLVELVTGDQRLRSALFTPLHPRAERRGVIAELVEGLELSRELHVFATLLVEQNRIRFLPEIRDALQELVDQAAGRVEAHVTSARPLSGETVAELRQVLSRRVEAEVSLELAVDPDLIGGVITRVGDLMFDGSVRTQLDSLAQNLRKGSA